MPGRPLTRSPILRTMASMDPWNEPSSASYRSADPESVAPSVGAREPQEPSDRDLPPSMTAEDRRLESDARREENWKRWGPYLSERQWGTVREDYSAQGDAWSYFPHEHARSRAYRWGEDGLLGIADRQCRLCFALALWNGRDPILKERLFGLTGPEGNHGEDVKECYYYLDSTPTYSYMKALYKYPQAAFPYSPLREESAKRSRSDREFELVDTGVFDESRYFDVTTEYAKADPEDILIRIRVTNRGPESATLHLLPTLWYRNTWAWGCKHEGCGMRPNIQIASAGDDVPGRDGLTGKLAQILQADHLDFGRHVLCAGLASDGTPPQLLFTENETNTRLLFGNETWTPHVKDAFHEFVVRGNPDVVNPKQVGTKVAALYVLELPAGGEAEVRLRLSRSDLEASADSPGSAAGTGPVGRRASASAALGTGFEQVFAQRIEEADEFFAAHVPANLSDDDRLIIRQAEAGLLWSKQFYHYIVRDWLDGDSEQPKPPAERLTGRNHEWTHLYNRDVISMPDKWEYPWYAAWDLAFHMIPFARLDPEFAKSQLVLFLREWYLHPNGQLPAYEFALGDVNPPVHAWACWRVYKIAGSTERRDRVFLSRCFQKLIINFTWWVNRKDMKGNNLFSGGFLGLDNIGVFDRSRPLPNGSELEQADATAWMAFFCSTMLSIALELSLDNAATEDMASKFFEHFVAIADAINTHGGTGLWDDEDGFYYDHIQIDGQPVALKVRSIVGVIPLLSVAILDDAAIDELPGFRKRMDWFLQHRPDLAEHITTAHGAEGESPDVHPEDDRMRLLCLPSREQLIRVLARVLDEDEFLSPYGIRSVSRFHRDHPYVLRMNGEEHRVDYVPGESDSGMFGGNSNWRGPVWFPINYLLIEALERYHHFYGESLRVECPTGSGRLLDLREVALELNSRLARIFQPDENGTRPCHGGDDRYATDPDWKNLLLFHEYFHGEDGRGLGASHQTGWTALVVRCFERLARATT